MLSRRFTWLLAALITLAAPLALAAMPDTPATRPVQSGAAATPPTEDAPPASIPVPEVARQAEEDGKLIRELDAYLVPGPMIEAIRKQLPESTARVKVLTDETVRAWHGLSPRAFRQAPQ
jgi:hypothetical protein